MTRNVARTTSNGIETVVSAGIILALSFFTLASIGCTAVAFSVLNFHVTELSQSRGVCNIVDLSCASGEIIVSAFVFGAFACLSFVAGWGTVRFMREL